MSIEITAKRERLLAEALRRGREAVRLNRRQYVVESLSFPGEFHVVTIPEELDFAVSCSGVGDQGSECTGWQIQNGVCSHSVLSEWQIAQDRLPSLPPPTRQELLDKAAAHLLPYKITLEDNRCRALDPAEVARRPAARRDDFFK